jgi:hypothetical protein
VPPARVLQDRCTAALSTWLGAAHPGQAAKRKEAIVLEQRHVEHRGAAVALPLDEEVPLRGEHRRRSDLALGVPALGEEVAEVGERVVGAESHGMCERGVQPQLGLPLEICLVPAPCFAVGERALPGEQRCRRMAISTDPDQRDTVLFGRGADRRREPLVLTDHAPVADRNSRDVG